MALTTEEAAVNTAAIAYITAVEALWAAKVSSPGPGAEVTFVPADIGDSAENDHSHSNNDTAVTTSYSVRVPVRVRGNGEFPIQITGHDGKLTPLVWLVTNSADELS
mgnify:CR=1 FL=1